MLTGDQPSRDSSDKKPWKQLRSEMTEQQRQQEKIVRPYRMRNCRIRKLGLAADYQSYLKSDLWAEQRLRVLKRDRFKCQGCAEKATEVHHIKYTKKTLSGKATYWMVSVCRNCHQFIEFYEDGSKVLLKHTKGRLNILRQRNKLTTSTAKILQARPNGQHGNQRRPVRERLETNETPTSRQGECDTSPWLLGQAMQIRPNGTVKR